MLLWIPADSSASVDHYYDVDEKGVKVRRQARRRAYKNAIACLSSLVLVFVVTVLQWQVPPRPHRTTKAGGAAENNSLRSRNTAKKEEKGQQNGPELDLLPLDSIYRLTVPDGGGRDYDLSQHAGQSRFRDRGFSVLAFPTNDFRQELGSNAEIRHFLEREFPDGTVNYPVLGLSSLHESAVYRQLSQHLPDQRVRHNFYKYLVDRSGRAVHLYGKKVDPLELAGDIEALLDREPPSLHRDATGEDGEAEESR